MQKSPNLSLFSLNSKKKMQSSINKKIFNLFILLSLHPKQKNSIIVSPATKWTPIKIPTVEECSLPTMTQSPKTKATNHNSITHLQTTIIQHPIKTTKRVAKSLISRFLIWKRPCINKQERSPLEPLSIRQDLKILSAIKSRPMTILLSFPQPNKCLIWGIKKSLIG